jgi:hypothetical protein
MLHGVDGAAASRQASVSTAIDILKSLNQHRSERVATTLQFFPSIHWILLLVLYTSINIAFFIDSNQGVLQYLNSLQVSQSSQTQPSKSQTLTLNYIHVFNYSS